MIVVTGPSPTSVNRVGEHQNRLPSTHIEVRVMQNVRWSSQGPDVP